MTVSAELVTEARRRTRTRHYVMTPPTFFAVDYAINPWMDPTAAVDVPTAVAQWAQLRDTYRRLGHVVTEVSPVPGLPDMVYAANAGLIVGDTAIIARFKHHQRHGESIAYARWMRARGHTPIATRHINEGQGDLLLAGGVLLAGTGFRTDQGAHAEIADIIGIPVVSLELTDPHFYHLDTALAVLDDTTIAYLPSAFTEQSRARLQELFSDTIVVDRGDADAFGLNAVSDGHHVLHPAGAVDFAEQLRHAGFEPIGIDMSELIKGGGAVKCCTLELYS